MVEVQQNEVLGIHRCLVERFADSEDPISPSGVKHLGLLDSALARPWQTAFGKDVHETVFQKAAALFHGLICNHPFHNGNKRTALLALLVFLDHAGYWLDSCSDDELYEFTR